MPPKQAPKKPKPDPGQPGIRAALLSPRPAPPPAASNAPSLSTFLRSVPSSELGDFDVNAVASEAGFDDEAQDAHDASFAAAVHATALRKPGVVMPQCARAARLTLLHDCTAPVSSRPNASTTSPATAQSLRHPPPLRARPASAAQRLAAVRRLLRAAVVRCAAPALSRCRAAPFSPYRRFAAAAAPPPPPHAAVG